MYLTNMLNRDPQILEAALEMHQQGKIPANSWVIDLDRIAENAQILSSTADRLGLKTYIMSKQHNRNPYVNRVAQAFGLGKMVAVDIQGVLSHRRYGIPLGHAGHLNQIPKRFIPDVVAMNPDIITVYNIEHAQWIDQAAQNLGKIQDIMLRIYDDDLGDIGFIGQEGGFKLNEVQPIAEKLQDLKNVRLNGLTTFPAASYHCHKGEKPVVTKNMDTLMKAREILQKMGINVEQINAPGNTGSEVMEILAEAGATHVEPGNALLGTTPNNALRTDTPEHTAFCYVTEISHFYNNTAYANGGGVYHTNYSDRIDGLIGSTWEQAKNNRVYYHHDVVQDIDYHMQLRPTENQPCKVGDSVLFAYRTQMHMTRSYTAAVSGLMGKKDVELHYICDNACVAMDENFMPVDPKMVQSDMDNLIKAYGK